jgi:hypothetical protein
MRFTHALTAAAVLACAATPVHAPAQIESTPIPAPGKPNFSTMSFLVGTWNCSTKSARRPAPFVTVSTYSLDPSGYWLNETSTTSPAAWIPSKLTIDDKITYDPDTKRWIDVLSGDQGAFGLSVSKGWNGNQMVWRDMSFAPGPDIRSQTPTTLTKVSDTKTITRSAFTETKTGRVVTVVANCNKG